MTDNLSFLLLLDTSGSMYGEKIYALNLAVSNMIDSFKNEILEKEPQIAIITFGGSPKLHLPFTTVSEIIFHELEARGKSPLTEALILTKSVITQKTSIILVSDGAPNDGLYERTLGDINLIDKVFAIGIGFDFDIDMLERFTKDKKNIVSASDAKDIAGYLLKILSGGGL